jgi:hypothetical protein
MIPIRPGTIFFCAFPEWADNRASLGVTVRPGDTGTIIVLAHPDYPVHFYNPDTKEWEELK